VAPSAAPAVGGSLFDLATGRCRRCPDGQYLDPAAGCINCTLPPDAVPTGPGSTQDDCPWVCRPGFGPSDAGCLPCSVLPCPTGFFRAACDLGMGGGCAACTPVENAAFVGPGDPFNQDRCPWQCNAGFALQGGACLPCRVQTCGVGEYLTACGPTEEASCQPCTGKPVLFETVYNDSSPCGGGAAGAPIQVTRLTRWAALVPAGRRE
jgi:hypothetical protein